MDSRHLGFFFQIFSGMPGKGTLESQGPVAFGISSLPPELMKVRKQGLGKQSESYTRLGSVFQNDLLGFVLFLIENLGIN